ncbi:UNVERIFIED_CONTAM: DNA-binding protein, partial [Bacillus mycoides]
YALQAAEQHLQLGGVVFQGQTVFTKQQVMALFEVSDATVERYISNHGEELKANGYQLLKGKNLKEFKDLVDVSLINEGNKAPLLGVFSFRAVLNLAMLLTESERAKAVRSRLLDIVMDVLAERTGGHTKYINQRDEHYLMASLQDESYRKQFTDALDHFVVEHQWKYVRFTNLIY